MKKRTAQAPSSKKIVRMGLIALAFLIVAVSQTLFLRAMTVEESNEPTTEETRADETDAAHTRRGVKPTRIDAAERERREQENAMRERVGETIGRTCEALSEGGQECDFESLKRDAISRISEAAELYAEDEGDDEDIGACFRENCSTTGNEDECALDQSRCFGMPSQGEDDDDEWDEGGWDEEEWEEDETFDYAMPSDDDMMQHYSNQYSAPTHTPSFTGTSNFLPDMKPILAMMETMMPKLPKAIAIFEEAGIDVPAQSRTAAQQASATFQRLKGPCGEGDFQACMELGTMAGSIEMNMRPPMERAMQQAIMSGKISLDRVQAIGMQIEAMMSEGMEHMGPPPGMMNGGHGPPQGMMNRGYGAPSGYGGMQGEYGPQYGY